MSFTIKESGWIAATRSRGRNSRRTGWPRCAALLNKTFAKSLRTREPRNAESLVVQIPIAAWVHLLVPYGAKELPGPSYYVSKNRDRTERLRSPAIVMMTENNHDISCPKAIDAPEACTCGHDDPVYEEARRRVIAVRGSDDVPGFELCVKAEMENMRKSVRKESLHTAPGRA